MTAAAIVTAVGGAVALIACVVTIVAMRKAYKLNRDSRETYEAAYNTLEEAAALLSDARGFVEGVATGEYRS